jgi:hypothetical protein
VQATATTRTSSKICGRCRLQAMANLKAVFSLSLSFHFSQLAFLAVVSYMYDPHMREVTSQYIRGKIFCSNCSRWYPRSQFGNDPLPRCPDVNCRNILRQRPRGRKAKAKMRFYQYLLYGRQDDFVSLP